MDSNLIKVGDRIVNLDMLVFAYARAEGEYALDLATVATHPDGGIEPLSVVFRGEEAEVVSAFLARRSLDLMAMPKKATGE